MWAKRMGKVLGRDSKELAPIAWMNTPGFLKANRAGGAVDGAVLRSAWFYARDIRGLGRVLLRGLILTLTKFSEKWMATIKSIEYETRRGPIRPVFEQDNLWGAGRFELETRL